WVEKECNWNTVAEQYVHFLESVLAGTDYVPRGADLRPAEATPKAEVAAPSIEDLKVWAVNADARQYLGTQQTRLVKTLAITPPGGPEDRVLEMGAYLQITPGLRKLGYGEVRG